jgi:Domain of unknown function (DUF4328)
VRVLAKQYTATGRTPHTPPNQALHPSVKAFTLRMGRQGCTVMATRSATGHAVGQPAPLQDRYRPMRWALIVYAIGEVALAVANSAEYYFRNMVGLDPFLDEGTVGLVFGGSFALAGLLQLLGLIASVILVSMWTFRAMKNLHLAGAPEVSMSPGWAVGWHFIPIANLWKPFEGILQIWRGSMAQAGLPIKVPAHVGWWWATWVISNMLANLSLRLSGFMEEGPAYDEGLLVAVVGGVVSVICTVLLLRTTKDITVAQRTGGNASVSEAFA